MPIIRLPTGATIVFNGSEEEAKAHAKFLQARYDFSIKYCLEKGWPTELKQLSIEQVLEIREQQGWKTPEGVPPEDPTVMIDARTGLGHTGGKA